LNLIPILLYPFLPFKPYLVNTLFNIIIPNSSQKPLQALWFTRPPKSNLPVLFSQGKNPGSDVDYSLPYITEIKEGSYTSTPPCACVTLVKALLPFLPSCYAASRTVFPLQEVLERKYHKRFALLCYVICCIISSQCLKL
jgi:hypothetical protein